MYFYTLFWAGDVNIQNTALVMPSAAASVGEVTEAWLQSASLWILVQSRLMRWLWRRPSRCRACCSSVRRQWCLSRPTHSQRHHHQQHHQRHQLMTTRPRRRQPLMRQHSVTGSSYRWTASAASWSHTTVPPSPPGTSPSGHSYLLTYCVLHTAWSVSAVMSSYFLYYSLSVFIARTVMAACPLHALPLGSLLI